MSKLMDSFNLDCWNFWKFFCSLMLALILVIVLILTVFTYFNSQAAVDDKPVAQPKTTIAPSTALDIVRESFHRIYPVLKTNVNLPTTSESTHRSKTYVERIQNFRIGFVNHPTMSATKTATAVILTTTPSPATSFTTGTTRPFRQRPNSVRKLTMAKVVLPEVVGKQSNSVDWNKLDKNDFKSCADHLAAGHQRDSVYTLNLSPLAPFRAKCKMVPKESEAWIVVQERYSNEVSFYDRSYADYEHGFGDPSGNHWIGLEKIYGLSKHGKKLVLRVEMGGDKCDNRDNKDFYIHGDYNFSILGPEDEYTLSVNAISGNITGNFELFENFDGNPFSTHDKNHCQTVNCADHYKSGGWWHSTKACAWITMNGDLSAGACNFRGTVIHEAQRFHGRKVGVWHHPTWTRLMVRIV